MWRGRSIRVLGAVVSAALALGLGGCGVGSGGERPQSVNVRGNASPECPSAPYQPRQTSGDLERQSLAPPAGADVASGRFVHSLTLDGGGLTVGPPEDADTASYSGDDAVC